MSLNVSASLLDKAQTVLHHVPFGDRLLDAIGKVKDGVKQLVIPGMLFEELGFTYLGPVDGHCIESLQEAIRQRVQHEEQIRQVEARMWLLASAGLDPQEWQRRELALQALHARLQTLQDALPLLLEQEAEARAVYLQARQEREALTRLHLRAHEHYQTELRRALQNELDEVVALAYQRTVSEGSSESPGNPSSH